MPAFEYVHLDHEKEVICQMQHHIQEEQVLKHWKPSCSSLIPSFNPFACLQMCRTFGTNRRLTYHVGAQIYIPLSNLRLSGSAPSIRPPPHWFLVALAAPPSSCCGDCRKGSGSAGPFLADSARPWKFLNSWTQLSGFKVLRLSLYLKICRRNSKTYISLVDNALVQIAGEDSEFSLQIRPVK